MELDQIVEKEPGRLRRWATFRDGFDVEIEYISKQTLEAIRRKCTKAKWRGHQRQEELDDDRFAVELAKRITNWRGLNGEVLKEIFPLKQDVNLNGAEIECSDSNKKFMLKQAYGFDDFVFRNLTELEGIEGDQFEEEAKNSDALSPPD